MDFQNKIILKYKNLILEVHRFEKKAQAGLKRVEYDDMAYYRSKETAAAKRASLDLTMALRDFRKSIYED